MTAYLRLLRERAAAARSRAPEPAPPVLTPSHRADIIWQRVVGGLMAAANRGLNHYGDEFVVDADAVPTVLRRVRSNLETCGFVWRHHGTTAPDTPVPPESMLTRVMNEGSGLEWTQAYAPPRPVVGAGCYRAAAPPPEDEDDRTVLYVEASWQERGFCLRCGEEHLPAAPPPSSA